MVFQAISATAAEALRSKHSAFVTYRDGESDCATGSYKVLLQKFVASLSKLLQSSAAEHFSSAVRVGKHCSPLVKVAYYLRCVTVQEEILQYARERKGGPFNLVLLGAGLDPLGVWARGMFRTRCSVLELDCSANVAAKEMILRDLGYDSDDQHVILPACDFSNAAEFRSSLSCIDDDSMRNAPTLVVSELVMTYLREEVQSSCLKALADHFGAKQLSFVAYELISSLPGSSTCSSSSPSSSSPSFSLPPTLRYQELYLRQFKDKIARGGGADAARDVSAWTSRSAIEDLLAATLGAACAINVRVESAADAAARATGSKIFVLKDMFDEHLALHLYLGCYAVVVSSPALEQRGVEGVVKEAEVVRVVDYGGLNKEAQLAAGKAIRELYRETYDAYSNKFPPIRRWARTEIVMIYSSSCVCLFA